jgi:class 3 adenylate cyclase
MPLQKPPSPARSLICCLPAGWRGAVRAHACELVALPLLLLVLALVTGLAATLLTSASSVAQAQLALKSVADGAAASFASTLAQALNPLQTVRAFIADSPLDASKLHSTAQAFFAAAAPGLIAQSPAIACIQLAPYGRLAAIYPLVTGNAADGTLLNLTGALGTIDLFNGAGSPNHRPAALLALSSRGLVIQGPQRVFACVGSQCSASISPTLALIARVPIFVATTNAVDVWADSTWPGASGGVTFGPFSGATNCSGVSNAASGGASLCSTNALGDGRRFWGFATILLSWSKLLALSRVSTLGDQQSQLWSVSRLPDVFEGGTGGATPINVAQVSLTNNGVALPAAPFDAGVVSVATVFSAAFAISLQLPGGWRPAWEVPAVVVVVLVSILAAGALFVHLVERRLRYNLLFSMLPARVVDRLGSQGGGAHGKPGEASNGAAVAFAERFDHVTMLFTDIVRFTDLVATITPAETMRMLNSLFLEFDEIAERAGVTKVETIGDAMVAVAGTDPPLRGPVEQALQMAAVALEMIDAASRHELPNGGQMRIRVGLHCGPVVAGVVGKTLPHWSLFGDTVNTTARMESTSIPGRVHVSSAFARIVFQAEDEARAAAAAAVARGRPPPPPFPYSLQSRGSIAVKGKGVLVTHFLLRRGDALLPGEAEGAGASSGSISGFSSASPAAASFYINANAGGAGGAGGLTLSPSFGKLVRQHLSGADAGGGAILLTSGDSARSERSDASEPDGSGGTPGRSVGGAEAGDGASGGTDSSAGARVSGSAGGAPPAVDAAQLSVELG